MNIPSMIPSLKNAENSFLQKDLKAALDSAQKILTVAEENNSSEEIIFSKIFIAKTYARKGRYCGDSQYFSKAFEMLKSIDEKTIDESEILNFYLTQSEVFLLKNKTSQADFYAQLAFQKSQDKNNIVGLVQSLLAKVEVFMMKNQFNEAADLTNQSLVELKKIDAPILKTKAYNLLCKIKIKQQDYNEILHYGQEVLAISQANGDVEKEIIASSNLGIYYATRLDYKSAIEYFFSSLEKSLPSCS